MNRERTMATGESRPEEGSRGEGRPVSIILLMLFAAAMYTCTTAARPETRNPMAPEHAMEQVERQAPAHR
jgi:hypothetical protein